MSRKADRKQDYKTKDLKKQTFVGTVLLASSFSTPILDELVYASEMDSQAPQAYQEGQEPAFTEETAPLSDLVIPEYEETEAETETADLEEETLETVIIERSDEDGHVQDATRYLPIGSSLAQARMQRQAPETFIATIGPLAQSVAAQEDLYASVMIAQAILESGWGSSALSQAPYHNLFGIKGNYQGQSVQMQTQEFFNGQWVTIYDHFRAYPSYTESLMDNARVLKTTSFSPGVYFYSGAWRSNTTSYRDATAWLTGRYATDPGYAGKLNSLIETYQLTRFDAPANHPTIPETPEVPNTSVPTVPEQPKEEELSEDLQATIYHVVSGDTLYSISQRFNVSIDQLKSWNGLTSDVIYPGQALTVKGTQAPNPPVPEPSTPTPEPQPQTPPQNAATEQKYTVQSGDTLYGISQRFQVSIDQLKSWNGLTSDVIYPGQALTVKGTQTPNPPVPETSTPTPEPQPQTPPQNAANEQKYTVQSGDTLYGISQRFQVSIDQLKSWNGLTSDVIYPGQVLRVHAQEINPPVASPPQHQDTSETIYTVQSGDTLYGISQRFGMSLQTLKQNNQLTSDIIYPGQRLKITNAASIASPQAQAPTAQQQYTVQPGDTLYGISQRFGLSLQALKQNNQLTSDVIYPGQRLIIQNQASTPKNTAVNTTRPKTQHYQVKSGDTLFSIAKRYQVTVAQLKSWNQLTTDTIYPGQMLAVQGTHQMSANSSQGAKTKYQVRPGDSLYRIATAYGVQVSQLKAWNHLTSETIHPGQVLWIYQ